MYCLLCHEKIARLRAWRTKSEFCCDEHAALYKKQTLERLLVDPGVTQGEEQSSLPEPPEPDEFENDEFGFDLPDEAPVASADEAEPIDSKRAVASAAFVDETLELPLPADLDSGEGIDELWRLADEVSHLDERRDFGFAVADEHFSDKVPDVRRQSAEDALEALRRLAARATPDGHDAPLDEPSFGAADRAADRFFDDRDVLREIEEVGEALDEPQEPVFDEQADAPAVEPAEPRVDHAFLDEPMAEAPQPFEGSSESAGAESASLEATADTDEADAALRELVGKLDAEPRLEESEPRIDLEAPEPEWDFSDPSNELTALKESLAGAGSPSAPFDPGPCSAAAAEPAWDEREALELDEEDVNPPAPELEDDLFALDAEDDAPFPAALEERKDETRDEESERPAAKAARNGVGAAPKKSYVRRPPPTHFRAVTAFAEIHIQPATWNVQQERPEFEAEPALAAARTEMPRRLAPLGPRGAGLAASKKAFDASAHIPAEAADKPAAQPERGEILAPTPSAMYLPAGLFSGTGRSAEWNMYEESVDLEPAPVLEISGLDELEPVLTGVATPFEPGGLFFDLAGGGPAREA